MPLLRQSLAVAAVAAVAVLACSSLVDPIHVHGVDVRATNGNVELKNRTSAAIYSFVWPHSRPLSPNWSTCMTSGACPQTQPGATQKTPYPVVNGIIDPHADVYWWHATATPNGLAPDTVYHTLLHIF